MEQIKNFLNCAYTKKRKSNDLNEKMHLASQSYFYYTGKPVWSDRNYNEFANEAYRKNVIAYRAISMIAQAAASVPFKLFQYNAKGDKHVIERHPILKLLSMPNPTQNGKEFMLSLYTYLQITGNVYLLGVGFDNQKSSDTSKKIEEKYSNQYQGESVFSNSELYVLQPDRVQIIAGENFIPQGYMYTANNDQKCYGTNPLTGRSQVLHIKTFNPLSDWYGMSPIEAASYSIDQHNNASAWNQALLQNAARPSGAIVVKDVDGKPQHLTDEQQLSLRKSIEEAFSGSENAGKPLLLQGGIEWKEMSWSPKDMDYIEAKNNAAREIALGLGMPPQLLGIPGDNTYSNLAEARIALWEQTIIPMVDHVVSKLNSWLVYYGEEKLELTYDVDKVTSLASRIDTIWNRLEKASFMTKDEKRKAAGLSDVDSNNEEFKKSAK